MPSVNFDRYKFAKDLEAHKRRKKVTLADVARVTGVSKSTVGNAMRGQANEVSTVLSLCAWLGKDISYYATEGLPSGVNERWTGKHADGRTVAIERGDLHARSTERSTEGKIINRKNRRYGNGFRGYEELLAEYKNADFIETEHITA